MPQISEHSETRNISPPSFANANATSPYRAGHDKGRLFWRSAANSYCFATFERRSFLPQSFKGSCYQIWCPVTGGAYQSARRVTWRARNNYKNWGSPKSYPQHAPNRTQRPFSPPSFPARRKRRGRRRQPLYNFIIWSRQLRTPTFRCGRWRRSCRPRRPRQSRGLPSRS